MTTIIPVAELQALVRAWITWDEKPGEEWRARSMESAATDVAHLLDVETTAFRITLVHKRIELGDRKAAVKASVTELGGAWA